MNSNKYYKEILKTTRSRDVFASNFYWNCNIILMVNGLRVSTAVPIKEMVSNLTRPDAI